MQCPKCRYEPTMAEMQSSPDSCAQCGVFFSKLTATQAADSAAGNTGSRGSKTFLLLVLVLAVFAGLGISGWKYAEWKRSVEAVETEVRLSSAHVRQGLVALDGGGSITFAEFFRKLETSVAEIDSAILRVSLIRPKSEIIDHAESYMKESQELMRHTSALMRAQLKLSTATDRAESAEGDISSSNEYISQAAASRKLSALNDSLEAIKELKAARNNMRNSAVSLSAVTPRLESIDSGALIDPPLLENMKNF
jgi:hypothetical protein